ncbi:MAG: LysM peptidoglycan-binding domain-containing protein [Pseudomonadota bacterium]
MLRRSGKISLWVCTAMLASALFFDAFKGNTMFSQSQLPDQRLARYDHVIIHVTATPPNRNLDDKDVDAMHRQRGFSGCGYNALIKRDGSWLDSDDGFVTRPIGRQGAHVGGCGPGWNGRSFGVSLVGGVDKDNRPEFNMTAEQMTTLARGIFMFMELHPKDASEITVMGHRDLIKQTNAAVKKACPCFDAIPWWESQVLDEDLIAGGGGGTPVDLPPVWTVKTGDTLSGISRSAGVPIATILALNPAISDPDKIKKGMDIRLA